MVCLNRNFFLDDITMIDNSKEYIVYNFSIEKNCDIPEMIVLEENLTIEEGQTREKYWIEYYRKQGRNILNKAPAGSIGTLGFKKRIQNYDRYE